MTAIMRAGDAVTCISIETGREGYHYILQHVLRTGRRRSPRGLATLDAGWVTVVIHDPTDMLPIGVGRRISKTVAAAEAVQLIGGFSDPKLLTRAAPAFAKFIEPDTERFHGAYGERIKNQLGLALKKIRADPDTRQAVITLWDPWLDNLDGRRDYPCTVALRLSLWDGRLDLDVVMRSNDAVLGFPYDIFQFGQLQQTAAMLLGAPVGEYHHTAWSLHIYESDLEVAESVTDAPEERPEVQPAGLARPSDTVHDVAVRARALAGLWGSSGDAAGVLANLTNSERWYRDNLASLVG